MKRAGSGSNDTSQSSTSDSEEDFLLDTWDDWMGSDSDTEDELLLHVYIIPIHINHVLQNWRCYQEIVSRHFYTMARQIVFAWPL